MITKFSLFMSLGSVDATTGNSFSIGTGIQ